MHRYHTTHSHVKGVVVVNLVNEVLSLLCRQFYFTHKLTVDLLVYINLWGAWVGGGGGVGVYMKVGEYTRLRHILEYVYIHSYIRTYKCRM